LSDRTTPPAAGTREAPLKLFREAMAGLAAGVAVIAARRSDGRPCGLTATSVSAFSADPPSLLVSVAHSSRCHRALTGAEYFGVHILRADQEAVAREFAGKGEDKFAAVKWEWNADVPEIAGVIAYLRCRRSATFERYDHSIVIGDVTGGHLERGDPLVYIGRRMDWLLRAAE
jgi:flavin reductase (DIM6/NTAB) family NADH-FMN oxidoreductase RutF